MWRDGLLEGKTVAADGAIGRACAALGAEIVALPADPSDEQASVAAAAALAGLDVLVARPPFVGGHDGLRRTVDTAFLAARVATTEQLAPGGGGLVVLVAPRSGDGPMAGPTRAALENTARTLATEWARFGVRVVAVLPGDDTSEEDVAGLVCFLCSRAGGYYSGCALTLGAATAG